MKNQYKQMVSNQAFRASRTQTIQLDTISAKPVRLSPFKISEVKSLDPRARQVAPDLIHD